MTEEILENGVNLIDWDDTLSAEWSKVVRAQNLWDSADEDLARSIREFTESLAIKDGWEIGTDVRLHGTDQKASVIDFGPPLGDIQSVDRPNIWPYTLVLDTGFEKQQAAYPQEVYRSDATVEESIHALTDELDAVTSEEHTLKAREIELRGKVSRLHAERAGWAIGMSVSVRPDKRGVITAILPTDSKDSKEYTLTIEFEDEDRTVDTFIPAYVTKIE